MILLPHVWWLPALLALVLLIDVVLSLRPPKFIRDCLDGVAFAANTGVIIYFASAAVAHLRARFMGKEFWINCLGMLALAIAVQVLSVLP